MPFARRLSRVPAELLERRWRAQPLCVLLGGECPAREPVSWLGATSWTPNVMGRGDNRQKSTGNSNA